MQPVQQPWLNVRCAGAELRSESLPNLASPKAWHASSPAPEIELHFPDVDLITSVINKISGWTKQWLMHSKLPGICEVMITQCIICERHWLWSLTEICAQCTSQSWGCLWELSSFSRLNHPSEIEFEQHHLSDYNSYAVTVNMVIIMSFYL